jgi:hypothetical protein
MECGRGGLGINGTNGTDGTDGTGVGEERPQEDPNPDKPEPNRISRKDTKAQRTKTLCDLAALRETPCSMCKNLSAQVLRVSENP